MGNGLRAEEKLAATAPATIVWTLDNIASIGGQKPDVLGAPIVANDAAVGPWLQFNGQDAGLIFPVNPIASWTKFTIEVLFRAETDGPAEQRFLHIEDERGSRALLETRIIEGKSWSLDTFLLSGQNRRALFDRAKLHPTGQWTWVALVYDGKNMAQHINGVKELDGEVAFAPMTTGRMSLGVRLNRVYWFKGGIRQIRFHPETLIPDALQRVADK